MPKNNSWIFGYPADMPQPDDDDLRALFENVHTLMCWSGALWRATYLTWRHDHEAGVEPQENKHFALLPGLGECLSEETARQLWRLLEAGESWREKALDKGRRPSHATNTQRASTNAPGACRL